MGGNTHLGRVIWEGKDLNKVPEGRNHIEMWEKGMSGTGDNK